MIRRLKIINYKSLKSVELTLQNLVVIFGPNAAGKSNLFDALNLFSRLVTKKNLKEAFEGHRGVPLEAIHYSRDGIASLNREDYHVISFCADIELSNTVIRDVEVRIKELRRGIDDPNSEVSEKAIITHRYLRYAIDLQIASRSGQVRVIDERLAALRKNGTEKTRSPFIEKVGNKISLRMEGQAHPTFHDVGL